MKTFKKLLGLAALLGLASTANAVIVYDDYRDFDWVGTEIMAGGAVRGELNLVVQEYDFAWDRQGYNPALEIITGAQFGMGFLAADGHFITGVNLVLGENGSPLDHTTVSVTPTGLWQTILGFTVTSEVHGEIGGATLINLQKDGTLKWAVRIDEPNYAGGISVAGVWLTADVKPVPDQGTTLALAGASLLGLMCLRRRLSGGL